jgi:hypothetical protein
LRGSGKINRGAKADTAFRHQDSLNPAEGTPRDGDPLRIYLR